MNFVGKTGRVKAVLKPLGLLLVAGSLFAGCAKLPKDDAQLTELKFEGLMGSRYTEILLVFGDAVTKNFTAGVYNTIGLNGANPAGGGDSCPAAILDKIDMEKVKKDNGALSTVKNGPRLWTVDYIGAKVGKERDFQGLKARWVMWFPIPDAIREGKDLSYQVMTAKRDTSMGIRKGSRAYILDDPQGNTFVMKSASLIKDPNQKFEDLKDLGSRLKLPPGWKFRSPILEQDLVFMTDKGLAHITQDDIGNTYDRVGGPYSNYKP
ncbi:MAG: hypothetical protein ACLQVJ_14755 [Syntrophobacteraceae bacterium]